MPQPRTDRSAWTREQLLAEIDRLEEEAEEHDWLVGQLHRVSVEGAEYWQKRTGTPDTHFPGTGKLIRYLLDEIALYRAHLNDVTDEAERMIPHGRSDFNPSWMRKAIDGARKFLATPRKD